MSHLTREGVKLVYDEAGSGPSMVLIHGWTCDRSHFAPQVDHFDGRYRCISVDLRGHGRSAAPEQEYSIAGFADDVAWVCDQLGITGAVVVGHSMGGAVALALAVSRPDLCAALVMLDPAILFPEALQPLLGQLIAGFRSPDGATVVRTFASNQFFLKSSEPDWKARLVEEMCRTPMHVTASAFESVAVYDGEAALKILRAPALYVEADPVFERVAHLRELAPHVMTAKTAGSGHFHQLEVPEQINAMIDRFLDVSLPG